MGEMPFTYERTIRLSDTDAAGVVFFPSYLAICHEAYEAALASMGVDLKGFFSAADGLSVPVAKSEADYLRPLFAGDRITVQVTPTRLSEERFALDFELTKTHPASKRVARVRTEHVCISVTKRERHALSLELARWVDAG